MLKLRDNSIFHYCSFATAIRFILPNRQLRLSPLNHTNDPRENKTLIFGAILANDTRSLSPDELNEMNKIVSDIIREDCKVLCFSYSDVLEGYQLSQMWAQYGDNHKGVCLGIDYNKFLSENKTCIELDNLKKVDYVAPSTLNATIITERYRNINMLMFNDIENRSKYLKNNFRKENAEYLFFTKSIEWNHEQEARLISFSDEIYEYCSIKNSLTHIFLGVDFDKKNIDLLLSSVDDRNCKVWPLYFSGEWLACGTNINKKNET